MKQSRLIIAAVAVAVLALGVAACGDDDATETTTTTAAGVTTTAATATTAATTTTAGVSTTAGGSDDYVTEVTVTANDTLFDVTEITAKAGVELTVTFLNIDTEADAPHNIHFRMGSVDVFTTPAEATIEEDLVFTPASAGTFTFFCDTHPDVMLGTFIVIP